MSSNKSDAQLTAEEVTAVAAVSAVIVGIVFNVLTLQQTKASLTLTQKSLEATRDSVAVAKQSLEQSQEQFLITMQAAREDADLRRSPRLEFDREGVIPIQLVAGRWEIRPLQNGSLDGRTAPRIVNMGESPAIRTSLTFTFDVREEAARSVPLTQVEERYSPNDRNIKPGDDLRMVLIPDLIANDRDRQIASLRGQVHFVYERIDGAVRCASQQVTITPRYNASPPSVHYLFEDWRPGSCGVDLPTADTLFPHEPYHATSSDSFQTK
jgi:hypothetical protein